MPETSRLTPVAVMILATLREADMHTYELVRLLKERRDDRLVPLQKGTIYHTVARLERDGLLAEAGIDRDGNRPERTTYTILDAGHRALEEWVRAELPRIDRPSEFRVALSEAHNLERAEVIDLLDQRRAQLVASVEEHHDGLTAAAERETPEQFLIELRRQSALLAAELAWQDSLRARLADRSLAWGIAEIPEHIKKKHRVSKETTP
ncbi:helix-turn-helix transcriptional regulator [Microbacterium sp. SL62]|uniref:PadR family transcriptional regulator n=1 Tax=Microbacterium sp. SL62 TaxID=2995139 RepID=UPI0022769195|nr:helix-turn-helix transcriptional regulator [Microbacterium sp. SL62]MCY1716060.1 helix-turn-helix transcriptional regulator [Microbacterium sp. SL62]